MATLASFHESLLDGDVHRTESEIAPEMNGAESTAERPVHPGKKSRSSRIFRPRLLADNGTASQTANGSQSTTFPSVRITRNTLLLPVFFQSFLSQASSAVRLLHAIRFERTIWGRCRHCPLVASRTSQRPINRQIRPKESSICIKNAFRGLYGACIVVDLREWNPTARRLRRARPGLPAATRPRRCFSGSPTRPLKAHQPHLPAARPGTRYGSVWRPDAAPAAPVCIRALRNVNGLAQDYLACWDSTVFAGLELRLEAEAQSSCSKSRKNSPFKAQEADTDAAVAQQREMSLR